MQSEYPLPGELERPSTPVTLSTRNGFALTPEDAELLKAHMRKFEDADTETRNVILEKAMGEIYTLRPPNSPFDKREAKLVIFRTLYS